jgi:signal transduction histidine kinase
MRRVFGNLMQNALIHSPHPVRLELRARAEGDGILFSVSDNGPGIPEEYHEVIFHKFRQVKSVHLPRTRSSGLGLAFCKLAVEAHGGRIWVRSRPGEGSVFFVSLPVGLRGLSARDGARPAPAER